MANMPAKGKWKKVAVDRNLFKVEDFEELSTLEELNDYGIIQDGKLVSFSNQDNKTKLKKKEKKKKNQAKNKKGAKSPPLADESRVVKPPGSEVSTAEESKQKSDTNRTKKGIKRKQDETSEDQPKKKKKKKQKKKKKKKGTAADTDGDGTGEVVKEEDHKTVLSRSDMSSWKNLHVPEVVLGALASRGFTAPTPIQALALPSAIRDKMDIVGAAETGSGKTLAFGIPLINRILMLKQHEAQNTEMTAPSGEEEGSDDEEDSDVYGNSDESDGDVPSDVPDQAELVEMDQDAGELDLEDASASDKEDGDEDAEDYDLPPDEEDLDELQDDEMGCVAVETDVDFDLMNEGEGVEKSEGVKLQGHTNKTATAKGPLYALVLAPTRELAIQVKDHLAAAAKYTDIKIATIVGGMAAQKQERVLKKCPEVVVATPGRLWELIQQGDPHLAKCAEARVLVVDEADRMVEKGHFQELSSLFTWMNEDEKIKKRRQTFIFSATLTFVPTLNERKQLKMKKKKKKEKLTSEQKLQNLMAEIGISEKPKIIDLTRKTGTAETLVEARIGCNTDEKDYYLYYFLQQYPGRTLVFTNSKDCIRRLVSVFTLLSCNPLPLHADMHQRQRLKNLDKFKGNPRGFLLATDVAARGLDIPNVEHVIHYQVPRTTENYVHRSGRTARATKEGLSVMLVGPDDMKDYRKIIKSLNRDEDLAMFPVEQEYMTAIKARVNLARQVDKLELKQVKQKKQNNWFQKAAKEMDIELDEDQLLHDMGNSREQALLRDKLQGLRGELNTMLRQPLLTARFSGKYPTKMGKLTTPYLKETESGSAVNVVRLEKTMKMSKKQLPRIPRNKVKHSKNKARKKK